MKTEKPRISPFKNESESISIGGLTIENRLDRVSIYGSIDLTRDKEGLAYADRLYGVIQAVLAALEAQDLPDKISINPGDEVQNPFMD